MSNVWSEPKADASFEATRPYRSLRGASWALVGILGLSALGQALIVFATLVTGLVFPGALARPETASGAAVFLTLLAGLLAVGTALLTLSGVPIWVWWHHRAAANLEALSRFGLTNSPGWNAGWWFVPIANLWKPYEAMKEVYRASDPRVEDGEWFLGEGTVLFPIWWSCWIVGNILSNVSLQISFRLGDPFLSMWLDLAALPLVLCATALYLLLVVRIAGNQDTLAHRSTPPRGDA